MRTTALCWGRLLSGDVSRPPLRPQSKLRVESPLMPEGPIKLYRTSRGIVAECDGRLCLIANCSWDELITSEDLESRARSAIGDAGNASDVSLREDEILAPIHGQEVWAAGVTYFRSRDARMEESKSAGGGDFYDRVYSANRPELFFKATASRVVGHGQEVAIRRDAKWSVPEPELVLLVSPRGQILGYTIGNDMSSRDIEGENPLYLPQAKVYTGSCALGPVIIPADALDPQNLSITLTITRGSETAYRGETSTARMRRRVDELVGW